MNNKKIRNFLISALLFIFSSALVFGAGYYRSTLVRESALFKASLPCNTDNPVLEPVIFDIQNEGLPKKMFQPGKISVGTGHGGGLVNQGTEPIWIQVQTTGFHDEAKVGSTNMAFDEKTGRFRLPLKPREAFVVDVEISVSREQLRQSGLISSGAIRFTDFRSGQLLAIVPVQILNSKNR